MGTIVTYYKEMLRKINFRSIDINLPFYPVTAVRVHAQGNRRRCHGDLAIKKSPAAYEVSDIKTNFHALTLSI